MRNATPASTSSFAHVCRAFGLLLVLFFLAPTTSYAQTWLVSTDPYVKLGVVDKFGQIGTYTAKFVVTNQSTGKEYILSKQVDSPQKGIDVVFPSEPSEAEYFATSAGEAAKATPGKYVWECQVAGKRVVSGRFTLAPAANDITVIEK
ncbi:hypothetical protein [Hymenobacter crusticola]|uniref:EfeO-type cupredoxin-like domain-containing protein n=1 Tax=Hymenobacter crusticola TaxID=1770526 RepID=A0A243WBT1_9BACT|nr:hypothetical protein [Hymenobacter crusticola]OUJ72468.1 hypothetical protein BXP70_18065 [Hymenobacter crusticola]